MKTKVVLLGLMCWISIGLTGQTIVRQVISPIGLSVNAAGNYISHTVGQPTPPGTTSGSKVVLRQGFEQPPKAKAILEKMQTVNLNIFPNPNNGAFYLTVETLEEVSYSFEIYDAIGKMIMLGDGVGNVEKLINLPFGTGRSIYIIKVKTASGLLGDGKIVVIG